MLLVAAVPAQGPVVRGPSDLPTTKFTLAAAPSAAFLDNEFLAQTLPLLRAEAERVRATMRIEDNALAHDLIAGLVAIALLQNRRAVAIELIAEARTTSAKPASASSICFTTR
jgi:hypothetical protein